MFGMLLLKPFSSFPYDPMESVNDYLTLLTQTDTKVQSPVGRAQNTRVCWKTLMCLMFLLLKLHILVEKLQITQNPDVIAAIFSFSHSLSSVLPFLTHRFKQREVDRSLEWRPLSGVAALLSSLCSAAESFSRELQSVLLRIPPTVSCRAEVLAREHQPTFLPSEKLKAKSNLLPTRHVCNYNGKQ